MLAGLETNLNEANADYETTQRQHEKNKSEMGMFFSEAQAKFVGILEKKLKQTLDGLDTNDMFEKLSKAKENLSHKMDKYLQQAKSSQKISNKLNCHTLNKFNADMLQKFEQFKSSLNEYNLAMKLNFESKESIFKKILNEIDINETEVTNPVNSPEMLTTIKLDIESLINKDSIYALSTSTFFYCSKLGADDQSRSVLKVVDECMEQIALYSLDQGLELSFVRSLVNENLYVAFLDRKTNSTSLFHYNEKFHKIKRFDTKSRKLHFINNDEIILSSHKKDGNMFTVLNHDCVPTLTFGQLNDPAMPFYLDEKNVTILGTSKEKIILR